MRRLICVLVAAGLAVGHASAQNTEVSATDGQLGSYLEQCRDHIADRADSEPCLSTLHYTMVRLAQSDKTICVPFDITKPLNEDYRSLVSWMYLMVDENPGAARQAMHDAAFEAMHALWPCAARQP